MLLLVFSMAGRRSCSHQSPPGHNITLTVPLYTPLMRKSITATRCQGLARLGAQPADAALIRLETVVAPLAERLQFLQPVQLKLRQQLLDIITRLRLVQHGKHGELETLRAEPVQITLQLPAEDSLPHPKLKKSAGAGPVQVTAAGDIEPVVHDIAKLVGSHFRLLLFVEPLEVGAPGFFLHLVRPFSLWWRVRFISRRSLLSGFPPIGGPFPANQTFVDQQSADGAVVVEQRHDESGHLLFGVTALRLETPGK